MSEPRYFSVTNIEGKLVTTELLLENFGSEENLINQFNEHFSENGKLKDIIELMGKAFGKKIDKAILVKQVA